MPVCLRRWFVCSRKAGRKRYFRSRCRRKATFSLLLGGVAGNLWLPLPPLPGAVRMTVGFYIRVEMLPEESPGGRTSAKDNRHGR